MRRILQGVAAGCILVLTIGPAWAGNAITVAWDPPSLTQGIVGYNLYYGTTSHTYTNMVSAGNATAVAVSNLLEGRTYYFAATSYDAAGLESPYSAELSFTNAPLLLNTETLAGAGLRFAVPLPTTNGDRFTFSLDSGAPAGARINPANGVFSWVPTPAQASTTNRITVRITDNSNPALSTVETLLIVVADYLAVTVGTTALQAGQPGTVPLVLTCSEGITNLGFRIAWPSDRLLNPALTSTHPAISSSFLQDQKTNLLITLQTAPGQTLLGNSQVAQLSFQSVAGQPSAFVPLPVTTLSGSKPSGSPYTDCLGQTGEVAVVGEVPLLRASQASNAARSLTLFGRVGAAYQVWYSTEFGPDAVWQPLLTYTQTNVAQALGVDSANPQVFYHLVQ